MIAPESIAEILGLNGPVRTLHDLETAVSAGLPKRALERLSSRLHSDRRTASAYKFKVVPQATWRRRSKRIPLRTPEAEPLSVLSTCVTKQTKDMRYSTSEP